MSTRKASHAGSWYDANPEKLKTSLDAWLAHAQALLDGTLPFPKALFDRWLAQAIAEFDGTLPVPGARMIIAPYVLLGLWMSI